MRTQEKGGFHLHTHTHHCQCRTYAPPHSTSALLNIVWGVSERIYLNLSPTDWNRNKPYREWPSTQHNTTHHIIALNHTTKAINLISPFTHVSTLWRSFTLWQCCATWKDTVLPFPPMSRRLAQRVPNSIAHLPNIKQALSRACQSVLQYFQTAERRHKKRIFETVLKVHCNPASWRNATVLPVVSVLSRRRVTDFTGPWNHCAHRVPYASTPTDEWRGSRILNYHYIGEYGNSGKKT